MHVPWLLLIVHGTGDFGGDLVSTFLADARRSPTPALIVDCGANRGLWGEAVRSAAVWSV